MSELGFLTGKFGVAAVAVAAVTYIVLRGEVRFRYPRSSRFEREARSKEKPSYTEAAGSREGE